MHAKREIPVSSCPSDIEILLYSGKPQNGWTEEETETFRRMLDNLDMKAAPYEVNKPERKKERSKFYKKMKRGIRGGEWVRVDTDGKFWVGNNQYIISDQEVQYQPISTEYGDYYAMDKVLAADGKFYDMNYDEIEVYAIGGIIQYDAITWVGTET